MSWSFRKSTKLGPFRINFSKSGIGYSFGVKGARISSGPRGTYVNFGAKGIYYRKKISKNNSTKRDVTTIYQDSTIYSPLQHTITSGPIDELTDADSKEFIEELTEKSKKISYFKWFGLTPAILFFLILFSQLNFENNAVLFISVLVSGAILFTLLCMHLYKLDKERLLIEIHYEIDEKVKMVYEKFVDFFTEITLASRSWQYLHAQKTTNYKYHAGAGKLINRIRIKQISTNRKPERFFVTNVHVPNIRLQNTDLYFFPERVIIKRGSQFASVFYKHLNISPDTTRFIEDEGVPNDSQVVDYTWRYLNKNGSPDRRFKNNSRLPICLYSTYTIESGSGIFEIISTSKVGAFDNFSRIIKAIGELQKLMPTMQSDSLIN